MSEGMYADNMVSIVSSVTSTPLRLVCLTLHIHFPLHPLVLFNSKGRVEFDVKEEEDAVQERAAFLHYRCEEMQREKAA